MSEKERKMEAITIQVQSLGVDVGSNLLTIEKNIESLRDGVKTLMEETFSKDNTSLTTQSKDSLSLGSQKTEYIEIRKE